jgi:hypothetical protein
MMIPTSPPVEEKANGFFKALTGGVRLIWSTGGRWERFFLIAPGLYVAYAVTLGALATYRSPSSDAFPRLLLVALSYVALSDSWKTPILSASVLRATIGKGFNDSDENARLMGAYLESLGHGGHWYFGNLLSIAYLLTMAAWGLVAVDFPSLTGLNGFLTFGAADTAFLLILWSAYRLLLMRLLRDARRAGFPIQGRRQWSG